MVYFLNLVVDCLMIPLDSLCGGYDCYSFLWAPVAVPIAIWMVFRGLDHAWPAEACGMNKEDCMQRVTWIILSLLWTSFVVFIPLVFFTTFGEDRVTAYMMHVQFMPGIVGLLVSWFDLRREYKGGLGACIDWYRNVDQGVATDEEEGLPLNGFGRPTVVDDEGCHGD